MKMNNSELNSLADKLERERHLSKEEWVSLIDGVTPQSFEYIRQKADKIRQSVYGKDVYIRGLIELTNYCKNDCLYCGIRRSNRNAERYRLGKEQILACCKTGYELGFRTFVMQGGEDAYYTDSVMCDIVSSIKAEYPDCAVTLSLGEKPYETYRAYKNAGADRYLLRHETASKAHYEKLHPSEMSFDNRIRCLYDLKSLGFQVGSGFMVGSPCQTANELAEDMLFLEKLNPEMVGIGPFVPHHDTPFANEPGGTAEKTILMVALTRILLPNALIPSTTALGTIDPSGREKGILSGANVVMPNLSPTDVRSKYLLYDNKICTGTEAAESLAALKKKVGAIGYNIVVSRGDVKR